MSSECWILIGYCLLNMKLADGGWDWQKSQRSKRTSYLICLCCLECKTFPYAKIIIEFNHNNAYDPSKKKIPYAKMGRIGCLSAGHFGMAQHMPHTIIIGHGRERQTTLTTNQQQLAKTFDATSNNNNSINK